MANAKREKTRGWTPNTFLPETNSAHSMDISTNLDAISEDYMDEDQETETNPPSSSTPSTSSTIIAIDRKTARHTTNSISDDSSSDSNSGSDSYNSAENSDEDLTSDHFEDADDFLETTSDDSDDNSQQQKPSSTKDQVKTGRPRSNSNGTSIRTKKIALGSLSTSPSNPSKMISAAPTRKISVKSKKTIKAKTSKGSLSSAASRQASEDAKLEAAKPIVSKFLDLENTKLNDKLLQVFMLNGMMAYVIESITRLDPEVAKGISQDMDDDANQESKFLRRVQQCRRKRDHSELNPMKKSYTAMNFITRSDVYNEFILSSGHQAIVKELFKIFRPESDGNFYHFQKVFETILKKFRSQTMATLFEDVDSATGEARTPLIFDMLPFLDQPPVALVFIKILFPTYTYGFAEKIQDYYRTLQQGHFMEMLLAMVTETECPTAGMGDFIVSLLDEATRAKDAKIFLACLGEEDIWAKRLADGVQSNLAIRRQSCIEILYSVLVRSIQMPFQDMFANSIYITEKSFDRVESHLERISNDFGKNLLPYLGGLCHAFVGTKTSGERVSLPAYTVPSSFTVARLWLLDSIYHCLNHMEENPEILETIPDVFWSALVDSFIQFRFNNAFHVQFYKIFRVALYSEQAAVYERFFVRTRMIPRLISHYEAEEQPTGSRAYIILILNCFRLSADMEEVKETKAKEGQDSRPSSPSVQQISPRFWTEFLEKEPTWSRFKDTLRKATMEQTRDTRCEMDPNLRFQFAPLQTRQPTEAPLTKRHIGIPGFSSRGNNGIDLGSRYGNSLGFGVPMVYDPAVEAEEKEKAEKEQELEVQKALANMMPNNSSAGMDWKLIPPQRVIQALNSAKLKAAQANGSTNKATTVNGSGTGSKDGSETGEVSETKAEKEDTPTTPSTGSSKTKKKKKNKKKRQIESLQSEDLGEEDEDHPSQGAQESGSGSESDSSSSQGGHSETDTTSEDDGDSDSSSTSSTSSAGSSNGRQSSHPSNGSRPIGTEGRTEDSEDLNEEERKELRKREKKREKKRKNKMNKKNKTGSSSSTLSLSTLSVASPTPDSPPSSDAMEH